MSLGTALAIACAVAVAGAQFISPAHVGGPYRGVVVDAVTKRPIDGAVVLAVWERERTTLMRIYDEFYDAREVLTDADGQFEVNAADIERDAPAKTKVPALYIYKPRYIPVEHWTDRYSAPKPRPTELILGHIFELKAVASHNDRLDAVRGLPPSGVPTEKMPVLIDLMNAERMSLGLPATSIRGSRND